MFKKSFSKDNQIEGNRVTDTNSRDEELYFRIQKVFHLERI